MEDRREDKAKQIALCLSHCARDTRSLPLHFLQLRVNCEDGGGLCGVTVKKKEAEGEGETVKLTG